MGTVPNRATQYKCVFNSIFPVVKQFPKKDNDVNENNTPSLYSLSETDKLYIQAQTNPTFVPELDDYDKTYRNKANGTWAQSKTYHVVQDLSSIQTSCSGHRTIYSTESVLSVNTLKEVKKQTTILAEKYNTIIDVLDKEFERRKQSNKYKNTVNNGTVPNKLRVNENNPNNNPDALAVQLNTLNNYINNTIFAKDKFKPNNTSTIQKNDIILAENINTLIETVHNLVQDCICYSDCNGYSVCWCYGNCNYY